MAKFADEARYLPHHRSRREMSIEIPDWVLAIAQSTFSESYYGNGDTDREAMRAAITAALEGWFAECGTTYYDTRDASLPTQVSWDSEPTAKTKVFTLRKDKTP